jgi:hypothetical protein
LSFSFSLKRWTEKKSGGFNKENDRRPVNKNKNNNKKKKKKQNKVNLTRGAREPFRNSPQHFCQIFHVRLKEEYILTILYSPVEVGGRKYDSF